MNFLEKVLNKIRISPHGIIPTLVGTGLIADMNLNLGIYENLPHILKWVEFCAFGLSMVPYGYLAYGIPKYFQNKKFIKGNGIDKRHVEKNLKYYCDKQAYKAAAYECGFSKEFDEINKNYKGERQPKWIPEF